MNVRRARSNVHAHCAVVIILILSIRHICDVSNSQRTTASPFSSASVTVLVQRTALVVVGVGPEADGRIARAAFPLHAAHAEGERDAD